MSTTIESHDLPPAAVRWFPRVLRTLREAQIPHMIIGGFGLRYYTGTNRETHDLDLAILPCDRHRAQQALLSCGLVDLYEQKPYDRQWIFRTTQEDVVVDLIWQAANYDAWLTAGVIPDITPSWFDQSAKTLFLDIPIRVVSAADICWMKMPVLQRTRCDWMDILNVIRATGGQLDWDRWLNQAGPYRRIIRAIVDIYDVTCPDEHAFIPPDIREQLNREAETPALGTCSPNFFDSRPWLINPTRDE